jgi:hypothetical protein
VTSVLAEAVAVCLLAWLVALAAVVLGRALFGSGQPRGLVQAAAATEEGRGRRGGTDPERVQMLLVSLGLTALYAVDGVQAVHTAGVVDRMPDVPDALAAAFAGSQSVYLSGKLIRRLP